MRFAPIAARDPDAPAVVDMGAPLPQSQAGRINVVVYRQIGPAVHKTANISRHAGSMTTVAAASGGKKNIFGMGAAFDAPQPVAKRGVLQTEKDPTPIATYSFRYAAIEALHLAKTTPKAWLDGQTGEIDATRLRPRAVASVAELDSKLRSEGFKLCGEARGLFDALSHQLCGTHQLSAYVEHVVVAELERRAAGEGKNTREMPDGEWCGDEYGKLFCSAKSPLRTYEDWRNFVESRRAAKGSVRIGARYDDALALKDDPPPFVSGDLVSVEAVEADEELGEEGEAGYEASVQQSSDKQTVVLKRLGAAEVMLKRNDWRLGGGGLASRSTRSRATTRSSKSRAMTRRRTRRRMSRSGSPVPSRRGSARAAARHASRRRSKLNTAKRDSHSCTLPL
jgi:hypothetical protein